MIVTAQGEMLTLKEASERFKVPIATLRFWRDRGYLGQFRRGHIIVVDAADVRREVDKRREVRREE